MDRNGLSAFLLGLGVGVGLGMLFAPKSGHETRRYIRDKAGESGDFIKQRGDEIRQSAAEWADKGKDVIGRQKESLSEAMEAGRRAYRDAVGTESAAHEG